MSLFLIEMFPLRQSSHLGDFFGEDNISKSLDYDAYPF